MIKDIALQTYDQEEGALSLTKVMENNVLYQNLMMIKTRK